MKKILTAFCVLVLSGCALTAPKPINVTAATQDSDLLALALRPPVVVLSEQTATEPPVVQSKQLDGKTIYIFDEINFLKLLDFIGKANFSIDERNDAIAKQGDFITKVNEAAKEAVKAE